MTLAPVSPQIPPRMRHLPLDRHGRPIPWFVAVLKDGGRDFRIAEPSKRIDALRFGNCWVCGTTVGAWSAFVIGPMCAVNRVTAEPACHRECAIYSATACPFLNTPNMRRRPVEMAGLIDPPGEMVTRNPGACLIWVTRSWQLQRTPTGPLIKLGDPAETLWFRDGRPATGDEVRAAIKSGIPTLYAAADHDDDPAVSRKMIDREVVAALQLAPA